MTQHSAIQEGESPVPGLRAGSRRPFGSHFETGVIVFVAAIAVAFMITQGPGFAVRLAQVFGIWAILAVSLNLLIGYTGLLSVAHVGFFGVGAYTVAALTTNPAYEQLRAEVMPVLALPFFVALPIGMVLAGLVALFVGSVLARFRTDIFVLVSFSFAIIAHSVFLNWRPVTRGPFGIHEIAKPDFGFWLVDGRFEFMVLTLVFVALVVFVAWLIVSSSFGRVLMAIREDEDAIQVFGYRAERFKLAVWVISAMMAALAGGLVASEQTFIDPNSFILLESILMVAIVIMGGLGSLRGSLLGAMIFVILLEGLRFAPFVPEGYVGQTRMIIFGVLLAVLMIFRPQGLVGRYKL